MKKALVRGAWCWCCHEKQLKFDKNLKFEIGENNVVERDNNIVFDMGDFEGMITIGVARAKKSIFPIRRGQDAVEKAFERDAWCRCCHAIKAEKHLIGEKINGCGQVVKKAWKRGAWRWCYHAIMSKNTF